MIKQNSILNEDLDKQRDLTKEAVSTIERLYSKFEAEKDYYQNQLYHSKHSDIIL